MSQYFSKPYEPFGGDIKTDLANLKTVDKWVDKLDIGKLVPIPTDLSLSRLSNVVKKDVYDELVAKVNNNDTSGFALKSKYNTDKTDLENKIPHTADFNKKAKLTELENKISDISNLATKTALASVENRIPNYSNLVNKRNHNTKLTEIENKLNNHNHDKYIDTPEFNKLAVDVFNVRLAQANLVTKTNFDAKLSNLT